jgi:hypothetical protein
MAVVHTAKPLADAGPRQDIIRSSKCCPAAPLGLAALSRARTTSSREPGVSVACQDVQLQARVDSLLQRRLDPVPATVGCNIDKCIVALSGIRLRPHNGRRRPLLVGLEVRFPIVMFDWLTGTNATHSTGS